EVRFERIRLQSLALAAACRAAELVLAKGEPERALELATWALSRDPISERAARTAIAAHRTIGSVAAAQSVAKELFGGLADAGLEPESDTLAWAARVGVRP
ncbi:MAG: hypothetical protein KDB37_02350, partial [Ilumatobacter sp.]|nr:hypothetical protein [Ilumatobacter sp.]